MKLYYTLRSHKLTWNFWYVGWSCVLNCLCYHPLFLCFLLICYPYIFNFYFYSCSCHFFLAADACLSWSLPYITEQQVSPHRLPMQYWLKNHRLSSNTPRTPTVFKESCNYELARLKKKKKKKRRRFWLSGDFLVGTFMMLFSTTGCVVHHESTQRWIVGCYNGL